MAIVKEKAKKKKTTKVTNVGKDAGKKEPLFIYCQWECKLIQPLWKLVWRFLKKLKIELPLDMAFPLLAIYSKKSKSAYNRDTCIHTFIMALSE
jgi:hypothetical protein